MNKEKSNKEAKMDMKQMKNGIGSKGEHGTFHEWEFSFALEHFWAQAQLEKIETSQEFVYRKRLEEILVHS